MRSDRLARLARATAPVVVRTWQPERDRRVLLVLDTGRTRPDGSTTCRASTPPWTPPLLLTALAVAGRRPGRDGRRRPARAQPAAAPGTDATPSRTAAGDGRLQPVLVETDWRTLVGAVENARTPARAGRACSRPLEPSAVEEGLLPASSVLAHARHRVVLASVRDPELDRLARPRQDSRATYAAAAAEQAAGPARRRTARLLGALGVEVLDADAATGPGRWPTTTSTSRAADCSDRAGSTPAWRPRSSRSGGVEVAGPAAGRPGGRGRRRRPGRRPRRAPRSRPGPRSAAGDGVTNASMHAGDGEHDDQAHRDAAGRPPLVGERLRAGAVAGRDPRPEQPQPHAGRPRRRRSARAGRAGRISPKNRPPWSWRIMIEPIRARFATFWKSR